MTSISSMILLVVLLLATYSYSAPIIIESKNDTMTIQLQSSTIENSVQNNTNVVQDKHKRKGVVSSDSSSSEESLHGVDSVRQAKFQVFRRLGQDATEIVDKPGSSDSVADQTTVISETTTADELNIQTNQKRETETEQPGIKEPEKRQTETEEPEKRETETEEPEKRETGTEQPEKRQTETEEPEKRETGTEQPEKRQTETEEPEKRQNEESEQPESEGSAEPEKREIEGESSTVDITTVEPTGETNIKRSARKFSLKSFESLETPFEFNKRAIGSIQSVEPVEGTTTDSMEKETSTNEPLSSASNFAKTTGLVDEKQSSTSESETTVEPINESTSVSTVEMQNTTKIVAVIPGRIAETKIVMNSNKEVPVVVQKPLSQGQN